MGIFQKIKLLWKVKDPAEKLIEDLHGFKSGWRTWPFWGTILGSLGAVYAAFEGIIPVEASVIGTAALTGMYSVVRGWEKMAQNASRPIFQSTEFYGILLAGAYAVLTQLSSQGINPVWMAGALTALGTIGQITQNMSGQRSNAERLTAGTEGQGGAQ